MKVLGLIVEYNPMHNGHIHHIKESKNKINPDITIAVMSGYFTQRGEPTIIDKWSRAEVALQNGIDLVVELPVLYAVQSADLFAYGAVSILNHLGVTDICFGSENGNIEPLIALSSQFSNSNYNSKIKTYLSKGYSYPKASLLALNDIDSSYEDETITKPNNILGVQYIKAAQEINPSIQMHTIQRIEAEYHDQTFSSSHIASATAIRNALHNNQDISQFVPIESKHHLYAKHLFHIEEFFPHIKTLIINHGKDYLEGIYGISEGLHNLIYDKISSATSFKSFLESTTSKRYTSSRIRRALIYILLHIKKKR